MTHKQYVASLDKHEAKALIKAAQERVEELEREKKDTYKKFIVAYEGRKTVNLFGEECYVNAWTTTYGPFTNYEGTLFEFSNGSKIVINLIKESK